MPYVPSIGDIINLGFLLKDLIQALQESKGSSAEYQDCIRKLQTLDGILREVEVICRRDTSNTQRESLLWIAYQCQEWIEKVLASLQKYGTGLRKGGSGKGLRDTFIKIKWRALRADELANIGIEVIYFCSVFSSHMSSATIYLLQSNERMLQIGLESIKDMSFSLEEDRRLLIDIRDQTQENNSLVRSSTSSTTAKIVESLDWIRNLSMEFGRVSQRISIMPWLIYQLFSGSRGQLPSYLERRLYQEPFYLRDSHGRTTAIPLDFVGCWSDFQALLDERFRGLHGHKVVQNKRYVLHEAAEDRDIEPWRPWETAFKAGQKIVMCIIIVDYTDWLGCPQCWLDSPVPYDTEIECTDCGMRYRREAHPLTSRKLNSAARYKRAHNSCPGSSSVSVAPKKNRLEFNLDHDAASFKCVRIVSQNKFEPGRSRERWIQQFNDAVIYMRQSRQHIFKQRPETWIRYMQRVRKTYQWLGLTPATINAVMGEIQTENPNLSVISECTSSVSDPSGPRHTRRQISMTQPLRVTKPAHTTRSVPRSRRRQKQGDRSYLQQLGFK